MAKFDIQLPTSLERQLSQMGNIDAVAPAMLEAASPVAVAAIKKRLRKHNRTQHLMDSVKAGKAKKRSTGGWYSSVGFKGYDRTQAPTPNYPKGTPNAVKAAGLEFGNSHQQPQPFLDGAANDCRDETAEVMQSVFEGLVLR